MNQIPKWFAFDERIGVSDGLKLGSAARALSRVKMLGSVAIEFKTFIMYHDSNFTRGGSYGGSGTESSGPRIQYAAMFDTTDLVLNVKPCALYSHVSPAARSF